MTVAGQHRKPGIFGEAGVSEGQVAEEEDGAARGFEAAGMEAVGTEPGVHAPILRAFFLIHKSSITQEQHSRRWKAAGSDVPWPGKHWKH
jgi:hypothetical protein